VIDCIVKKDKKAKNYFIKKASELFYQRTESHIYKFIKDIHWKDKEKEKKALFETISDISKKIFKEVMAPYRHNPEYLIEILRQEKRLELTINKILKENPANE
jgi:hypothetical protein